MYHLVCYQIHNDFLDGLHLALVFYLSSPIWKIKITSYKQCSILYLTFSFYRYVEIFQAFFVRSFRIIKRRYIQCFTAFNFEFCPYNFTIIDRMEFCNFIIDEVFIDCKKYSPTLLAFTVPSVQFIFIREGFCIFYVWV